MEVRLESQPLANAYADTASAALASERYPLANGKCPDCGLVQLYRAPPPGLFDSDYPFRQGTSKTWVAHLERWTRTVSPDHGRHLDVGANDGTLIKLMSLKGWTSWGVDPAPAGPMVASGTMGLELAKAFLDDLIEPFNLITAFNVLAHVSDLDDFLGGIALLLHDGGRAVFEVPDWSLSTWMSVYHEHQCYFTKETLTDCLQRRGFLVVSMESQPTHEGSWRATCMIA